MGGWCDGRGMGSTGGVKDSAQGSWDVWGRQDGVGFVPVGLRRGWAVPASSLCCAGMEFPALPWTPREHETCTSGSGVHVALPVYLFLQILPN